MSTRGTDHQGTAAPTLDWDKPGPGTWMHDAAHNTRPVTRPVQAIFPEAMQAGFQSFTARYGMLLDYVETGFVNGYSYQCPRIVGAPRKDGPPPPAVVLKVVTRLHPEMRRRNKAAKRAIDERIWREDLDRWHTRERPRLDEQLRALQREDPSQLDDDELAGHVRRAEALGRDAFVTHFALIGSTMVPVGLYLATADALGVDARVACEALAGSSPGSVAGRESIRRIAEALPDGVEPSSLDDIRAAAPAAAAALDAYLEEFGWRLATVLDLDGRAQCELPGALVASVLQERTPMDGVEPPSSGDRLWAGLDAPARRELEAALEEAVRGYGARDDHAGYTLWGMGLLRRAVLEAGDRLQNRGATTERDDVFLLEVGEITGLLEGTATLDEADIDRRRRLRQAALASTAPPVLGDVHEPPSPDLLPSGLRRLQVAATHFLREMNGGTSGHLRGLGVGVGTVRGRAVVALDIDDAFERLEPGDILVTTATNPAFNPLLELVAGIVTSHGGAMCHAAIVARELGTPAVIGVEAAIADITDGAEVEIDATAGTVRVVSVRRRPTG